MKKAIAFIALSLLLTACSAVGNIGKKVGKSQQSLSGTSWVLADAVKGKTPTLTVQEGKVSGHAGCNTYSGELVLDASQGDFSVKNITSTRMACEQMAVERNFLSVLSSANKYVVSTEGLELYKDGLLLMKLRRP